LFWAFFERKVYQMYQLFHLFRGTVGTIMFFNYALVWREVYRALRVF